MAPGERMITIPGFGDHVRADWPITINGMRMEAGDQQRGFGETRARAQQSVEPAIGFEVLDAPESGQDTLPGAGAVARVLDDLQIAALPGGFDAEEHAGILDGTARLERISASRKLIFVLHAP